MLEVIQALGAGSEQEVCLGWRDHMDVAQESTHIQGPVQQPVGHRPLVAGEVSSEEPPPGSMLGLIYRAAVTGGHQVHCVVRRWALWSTGGGGGTRRGGGLAGQAALIDPEALPLARQLARQEDHLKLCCPPAATTLPSHEALSVGAGPRMGEQLQAGGGG